MAEMPSTVGVTIPLYTRIKDDGPLLELGSVRIEVPIEVRAVATENEPGKVALHFDIPDGATQQAVEEAFGQVPTIVDASHDSGCKCKTRNDGTEMDEADRWMLGSHHEDDCPMLVRRRSLAEQQGLLDPMPAPAQVNGDIGSPVAGEGE